MISQDCIYAGNTPSSVFAFNLGIGSSSFFSISSDATKEATMISAGEVSCGVASNWDRSHDRQ